MTEIEAPSFHKTVGVASAIALYKVIIDTYLDFLANLLLYQPIVLEANLEVHTEKCIFCT
ncbi:hypothetical protein [Calothrix sp. NIES-2098]|uniref:hypothetical protein n=1 Tax=Calothrix sp. NIES-2098 TaxID=1954171 RepID=UPI000BBB96C6